MGATEPCSAAQVDLIDRTEGLDHDAIREYVAELVTAQLGDSGFLLRPDQVRVTLRVVLVTPGRVFLAGSSPCAAKNS